LKAPGLNVGGWAGGRMLAGYQLPGLAAFMRRAKARVSGHPPPSAGPGLWQLVDAPAGAMVDTGEDPGPALAG